MDKLIPIPHGSVQEIIRYWEINNFFGYILAYGSANIFPQPAKQTLCETEAHH